jgi:hypothetical protein
MLRLTIEVTGNSWDELEYGLDEIRRKIRETYTSGSDKREDGTGSYKFDVDGEEEEQTEGE